MAEVILKNIKKIYPHQEPKKKKKGEPEKKTNLQITEEGVLAVDNFNLHIQDKEFIVLVGPSGCGKSTTLRMVAGLEEISGGELYIGGQLMNDVAPKDRDISMVFQNYALYPHMTVRENIAFPLKLRKMDKAEIDQRVEQAAEILDITEYLDRKPKALSGGQRQRVAIGRAIVREPKVLLMDEPLSNLDAKLRNQMRAELIKLRQRINTTFIYVTHDQTEAMTLGDRIVIMKDGVIQQIGSPQDIYNEPVNAFVADFIGESNIMDGIMHRDYLVEFAGDNFECVDKGFAPMEQVDVVVRPEDIEIVAASDDVINGVVEEVTFKGVHYEIVVKAYSDIWIIHSTKAPRPGDVVGLSFGPEDIHIMKKSERKKVNYFSSFKNEDNDMRVEEEEIEQ